MDGGEEGTQGGGNRRRGDVVGGGIPLRLGTALGGPSAGAGGQPGGDGSSFRCGPHFSAMGGDIGEIVEVCHGQPGQGKGGGPFWVPAAAVQGRCFGIHLAGDDSGGADCGGHGLDPPHRCPDPQETCQKWRRPGIPILPFPQGVARGGEKGVGGAGLEAHGA